MNVKPMLTLAAASFVWLPAVVMAQPPASSPTNTPSPGQNAEASKEEKPLREAKIRYEVFSLDLAKAAAMRREKPTDQKFYQDLVAATEQGVAALESLVVLRGSKTSVWNAELHTYPDDWEPTLATIPAGALPATQVIATPPAAVGFVTRNVGEQIETETSTYQRSPFISAKISGEYTELAGRNTWGEGTSQVEMPVFESRNFEAQQTLPVGEPRLLGTVNPPPDSKLQPNRIWFAFATASIAKE